MSMGINIWEFRKILDIYRIRSEELKPLILLYITAVTLAAISMITIGIFKDLKPIIIYSHLALQISILIVSIKTYALNPNKLRDISYLVRNLTINPHFLIESLNISPSLSPISKDNSTNIDTYELNLHFEFPIINFRFLFILSGDDNKVHFVSFGTVSKKLNFKKHILPFSDVFGGEFNRVELCNIPLKDFRITDRYNMHFLLFTGFYPKDQYNPYYSFSSSYHKLPDGVFDMSMDLPEIRGNVLFDGIKYGAIGDKINTIEVNGDDIVSKVFNYYIVEFLRTKKIHSYVFIDGKSFK